MFMSLVLAYTTRPLNRVICSSETHAPDLSGTWIIGRTYVQVIGARVYQILATTPHGVDTYARVFNSLVGASVIASSEESIFLVRTPIDLVLFPGSTDYQVLLDRNNFSKFWNFFS